MRTVRFDYLFILIVGFVLGALLFRGCGATHTNPKTEIIKTDTVTTYITDTFTIVKPQPYKVELWDTLKFTRIDSIEKCNDSLKAVLTAYLSTNYYNIDTTVNDAKIGLKISTTRNLIDSIRYDLKITEKTITKTVQKKQKFQVLVGAGVSYPFSVNVATGFRTKKGLILTYQYDLEQRNTINLLQPIVFKRP
jgi:hypothetical protein